MTDVTPLTPADLTHRKCTKVMHVDYSRSESATFHGIEGVPRLKRQLFYRRGENQVQRWLVDDKYVPDLETALAVINDEITLEAAMEIAAQAEMKPKRKVSLIGQIQEVEYEIAQREKVYPGLVRKGSYKQEEADMHVDRMKAVWATLDWFRREEQFIRWAITNRASIEQRMSD